MQRTGSAFDRPANYALLRITASGEDCYEDCVDERKPPVLYGNCQAGWAIALLSADCEGLVGPAVLNGSPREPSAVDRTIEIEAGDIYFKPDSLLL